MKTNMAPQPRDREERRMTCLLQQTIRQVAAGAALGMALVTSVSVAHADETRVYSGSECSLSGVSSSLQDRSLGKLRSTAPGSRTVVCPLHRLEADTTVRFVHADVAGDPTGVSCRLHRRAPNGQPYSNAFTGVTLISPDVGSDGLWRHSYVPVGGFTMGYNQSVAVQCTLTQGSSILRYRARFD